MFSVKMQKLFAFVLLFGFSVPLGSALPKNVIHGHHFTELSVKPIKGHLTARASVVDYTEAYNQLMKLLHDIYGENVGKVLQDPEWLTRVCSQVCAPDDEKCHQTCVERQISYLDVNHIAQCATHCEKIPHEEEASLRGEYGACLVSCLKRDNHENTKAFEEHKGYLTPSGAAIVPTTKSKANQGALQTFPYSVTLMDVSTTSVIQVISRVTQRVEDLSTEDEELKYLTPVVKAVSSPTVANSDTTVPKVTTLVDTSKTVASADLDVQNVPNQPTSVPIQSFTTAPNANVTPPAVHPVAVTTMYTFVDSTLPPNTLAPPTPSLSIPISTTEVTNIVEQDSDLNQIDTVPTFVTLATESESQISTLPLTSTVATNSSGALTTTSVGVLDDLEISNPGVKKHVGLGLNFTNMTTTGSSTGTSRPGATLDPGLAEGAAATDTPFLSFSSSTSLLLAVVIGFGLIMG